MNRSKAATSISEMKACLNMMLSMQKALAEKFSVLLLQKGICSPVNKCTRVKCNKGNNGQPQLEAYAKIQVVVVI
jgi:predicted metal-binding protein